MAASKNFVTKHVKIKYGGTADGFFLGQRFWSLERTQALINHFLVNNYGFVTVVNLRYHAMSIRSWLNNIFMVIYANQYEISQENDILRYSSFAKLNQYKICFPMIYRLLRFEEKTNMLKKVLTSTV